ncbi:MAG: HTTM domain-containing protein, partial [Pirellulaceae bacterium]|nr:HTTM domain-containing protein [Pirellulaceae bacterium]
MITNLVPTQSVGTRFVSDKTSEAMRTRGLFQTIAETAFEPRDVASLVFFRIAFGVILLWEVLRYFLIGWIDSLYLLPAFHFTYLGFGWVRPWPGDWLFLHFLMLGIAAAGLALGYRTRLSAAVLCVGWSYVLLLEKSAYLNHLYLICLLAFLMIFIPAGRACSWDVRRRPDRRSDFVPAVALWVLRGQIAIPYFFGALAKLNGDWLHGQPMQMWMSRMTHVRQVVPAFGELWLALAFSYGGFLLDLFVVPFLLWRRTRVWAFGAAVAFHLMNALVFRIGIFPWFMICATTLFFDPDWPRRAWRWLSGSSQPSPTRERGVQSRFHAERGNEMITSSLALR